MLFAQTTFLGIDPTAGERPFTYAALDHERKLLALGQGSIDDVLAFAGGQRQAYVAVCAPRRPNQGIMRRPEVRQNLAAPLQPGRWMNFRLADYLLRRRNISIPQTPAQEEDCSGWMRMGFSVHRRLEEMGYCLYPQEGASLQLLEVYPHACFAALLGVLPFSKHTLEGRIQRQLALYEQDLAIPDAMRIFEEITRHRLLNGVLPLGDLYSTGELDALVAAYTAWKAALHPDQVSLLGDPAEGQIVVPVNNLKEKY